MVQLTLAINLVVVEWMYLQLPWQKQLQCIIHVIHWNDLNAFQSAEFLTSSFVAPFAHIFVGLGDIENMTGRPFLLTYIQSSCNVMFLAA